MNLLTFLIFYNNIISFKNKKKFKKFVTKIITSIVKVLKRLSYYMIVKK